MTLLLITVIKINSLDMYSSRHKSKRENDMDTISKIIEELEYSANIDGVSTRVIDSGELLEAMKTRAPVFAEYEKEIYRLRTIIDNGLGPEDLHQDSMQSHIN